MGKPAGKDCVYRIDAQHRLRFMNPEWNRFAMENCAAGLRSDHLLGTHLWDHIDDPTTRELYHLMLERAAETGGVVEVPFRCDSPDKRRFMKLSVTHFPDDSYEFTSSLLRVEPRSVPPILDPEVRRNDEVIISCSWCKRFAIGNDWVEVEHVVKELGLFESTTVPKISHGICSCCKEGLEEKLD